VRYLQYLLSIDYFALPGQQKEDKSSWIASLTCISGCLNGSLSPYAGSFNEKTLTIKSDEKRYFETLQADGLGNAFKALSFVQNLIDPTGTQDQEPENVVKVYKQKPHASIKSILIDHSKGSNHDILYEMGPQYGCLMDLNHESVGMNKRSDETHLQYINRLCANKFAEESHDHAIPEFPPIVFQQRNKLHLTSDETYYFAISSGEQNRRFVRHSKEYFTEPTKTSKMALGFDTDVIDNLRLVGSVNKIRNGD